MTLSAVLILMGIAVMVVAVLRRLHLPPVLGYLMTGIAVGPYALGWVDDTDTTSVLAEFGVVFLLFTLGLEFSLPRLIAMRKEVLVLGGAQVVVTTLAATALSRVLGVSPQLAVVLGGVFAMSSTAMVIKQLAEQVETQRRHGQLAVGVLLFQDLAVIPFLILIPTLAAPASHSITGLLGMAVLKGLLALAILLAAGRWLLRPVLHEITKARSAELFTLAVLLVTLGAAAATHALGLSYALGAFLAGMMLGETEFRHQVEGDIRPFRDVLLGLFFITVGMLLDLEVLWAHVGAVLLVVVALVAFKIISIMLLARLLRVGWRTALRTGLVLAQGGEFGFALLTLGLNAGMLDAQGGQIALAAIVVSMLLSPLIIRYNGAIARRLTPDRVAVDNGMPEHDVSTAPLGELHNHVLICGFGRVGQNVARFLEEEGFEYLALDLDPLRVRTARAAGDPVYYGDFTQLDTLRAAGVEDARIVVVTYFNTASSMKLVEQVRRIRPDVPVLVRTRDDTNLEDLQAAGATEVVPETLEASLMLVSHLLLLLDVPMIRVLRRIQDVREHRYSLLRNVFRGEHALPIDRSHAFREELHTVELPSGARAVGQYIRDLGLDAAGVMITAVRRDGILGKQPEPETQLREGDVLILYGKPEDLEHAEEQLLGG